MFSVELYFAFLPSTSLAALFWCAGLLLFIDAVGLNDFLMEWSSAKPLRVSDFGTTSSSVEA